MRNLYDKGISPKANVGEHQLLTSDGSYDTSQHESEAPSQRLFTAWETGAVLLGFLGWLNDSMKDDRNFGRRIVRNYTESLVLNVVTTVLIISMSVHHDLPMAELSFPLLTVIASVTFTGQYITRLLRYRVHMNDVNYVVTMANAVAWMLSDEEACH